MFWLQQKVLQPATLFVAAKTFVFRVCVVATTKILAKML